MIVTYHILVVRYDVSILHNGLRMTERREDERCVALCLTRVRYEPVVGWIEVDLKSNKV